jgi:hypothetical protein
MALPAAGAALAAAIPYGGRMIARGVNNKSAQMMLDAVDRAREAIGMSGRGGTAAKAASRGELTSALRAAPAVENPEALSGIGLRNTLSGMGITGESAIIPYEIDRATLPDGSHGRREADDPRAWLMRGGFGSLGGLTGARIGLESPIMRGQALPPIDEMRGLLEALTTKRR